MLDAYMSEFNQAASIAAAKMLVVINNIAAGFFILEGLGDLPFLHDHYLESGMGEISPLQMFYFTFTTISTVLP